MHLRYAPSPPPIQLKGLVLQYCNGAELIPTWKVALLQLACHKVAAIYFKVVTTWALVSSVREKSNLKVPVLYEHAVYTQYNVSGYCMYHIPNLINTVQWLFIFILRRLSQKDIGSVFIFRSQKLISRVNRIVNCSITAESLSLLHFTLGFLYLNTTHAIRLYMVVTRLYMQVLALMTTIVYNATTLWQLDFSVWVCM